MALLNYLQFYFRLCVVEITVFRQLFQTRLELVASFIRCLRRLAEHEYFEFNISLRREIFNICFVCSYVVSATTPKSSLRSNTSSPAWYKSTAFFLFKSSIPLPFAAMKFSSRRSQRSHLAAINRFGRKWLYTSLVHVVVYLRCQFVMSLCLV